jgi:TetR/AcrR family transcriptional regulator, cholesterol catabolism regulator
VLVRSSRRVRGALIPRNVDEVGTAIEDAARKLFATQGFAGTSIRDLAKAAGVSSGSIYNYAESKEELLWRVTVATLNRLLVGVETAVESSPCPGAQLESMVHAHVRYHALNPRPARISSTELQYMIPRHRREVASLRDRYEQSLRSMIRRGDELGFFDAALERYATFSILEMGYGVGVWYRPGGELSVDEIGDVYATLALRMVAFDAAAHLTRCPDERHAGRITPA